MLETPFFKVEKYKEDPGTTKGLSDLQAGDFGSAA